MVPAKYALYTRRVREQFWTKIRQAAAQMPFAKDLTAAYYAARDPQTHAPAQASLLAALIALNTAHIGEKHWALAQAALEQLRRRG